MKLIPFLRFGGSHHEAEEDDIVELPPDDLLKPPEDEETDQVEDEEEKKEENGDDKGMGRDDDLLRAFISVDEELVDNSGLAAQMEDVPAEELVRELRAMASAFGIHVSVTEDEAV